MHLMHPSISSSSDKRRDIKKRIYSKIINDFTMATFFKIYIKYFIMKNREKKMLHI